VLQTSGQERPSRSLTELVALGAATLLRDHAPPPTATERQALFEYVRDVALAAPAPEELTAIQQRWADWLSKWSLPLGQVTDARLRLFIERVRSETPDGRTRQLADTSVAWTRAVVMDPEQVRALARACGVIAKHASHP
jgi:hypothetical protein